METLLFSSFAERSLLKCLGTSLVSQKETLERSPAQQAVKIQLMDGFESIFLFTKSLFKEPRVFAKRFRHSPVHKCAFRHSFQRVLTIS